MWIIRNKAYDRAMFSNVAKYLWGSQTSECPETVATHIRLLGVDADDDDWVLIEKSENEDQEDDCCDRVGPGSSTQPLPLTRTSSCESLPCLSMEESWFLTPPPCFTSEGPVHMETSPLENLLIEHPSMSVYQHRPSQVPYLPCRSRSLSPNMQPLPPQAANQPPPRRQPIYALHWQQQQGSQYLQIKSAQKVRQCRAHQTLKRNKMERSNKAREVNSRNKVQRRSDHMQHHSGANNNRKC